MKSLNLSQFKKISSDGKSTTLKSPEGHKIIVAHHALSPKLKKQLADIPKKYADGGEVESDRQPASMLNPEEAQAASDKKLSISKKEREGLNAVREMEGALPSDSMGPPRPQPGILDRINNALSLPGEQEKLAAKIWQKGIAADNAALNAPIQGPAPASVPQQPSLAQPAPQESMGQSMLGNYAANYNRGIQEQKAGYRQEAAATGQLGAAEADIEKENQALEQKAYTEYRQKFADIQAEYKNAVSDVEKQHINPNRYQESQTSGQKVMTAIGIFLGGLGAGMTKGENPAMKWLNDQINRDIEAQKAQLGKSSTLLSAYAQQFGNLNDATQMATAVQKGIYASKIRQAGALSKDPIAKAKALQFAGQLDAAAAAEFPKLAASLAASGLLSQSQAQGSSPLAKIQALPKEMRDEALKEYAAYKAASGSLSEIDRIMSGMGKVSTLDRMNPFTPDQIAQKSAALVGVIKPLLGEAMQEADVARMITPFVPGIMSNSEAARKKATQELKAQVIARMPGKTPILSEMGIVPPLAMPADVKMMNGKPYVLDPTGKFMVPVK